MKCCNISHGRRCRRYE